MGLVQWKHCAYLTAGGGLSGGSGLGGGGGLQARVSDLECHHVKQKVSRHAGANRNYTTGSRCHFMQVAAARAGSARHCAGLQAHFKTMGIQTALHRLCTSVVAGFLANCKPQDWSSGCGPLTNWQSRQPTLGLGSIIRCGPGNAPQDAMQRRA